MQVVIIRPFLYNDRVLLPDEQQPLPFEARYRNRSRRLQTLVGPVRLTRDYFYHAKSGTGRCSLDDLLGLEGSCNSPPPSTTTIPNRSTRAAAAGATT